jgi:N-acetylmuramic acid 6-phosphate (MurNAc-6-P) etherase
VPKNEAEELLRATRGAVKVAAIMREARVSSVTEVRKRLDVVGGSVPQALDAVGPHRSA